MLLFAQTTVKSNFEFNDTNDQTFLIANENGYESKVSNGYYNIVTKQSSSTYRLYSNIHVLDNEDYTIKARIRADYGDINDYYGLYLGKKEQNEHFVCHTITPGIEHAILEWKNNEWNRLLEWDNNSNINKNKNWNELTIEKKNGKLTTYINGVKNYSAADRFGNFGEVGILFHGNLKLEVDYVRLEIFNREINLVTDHDKIKPKERLSNLVNSEHTEVAPIISADGNTLYVVRNGPRVSLIDLLHGHEDSYDTFWKTEKENDQWGYLKLIKSHSFFNTRPNTTGFALSTDGNTFIVPGVYENKEFIKKGFSMVSRKKDGSWLPPTEMKIKNLAKYDKGDQGSAKLSRDGQTLLLDLSPRIDEIYYSEIYVSFKRKNGNWTEPKNLGPIINKNGLSSTPTLASDGKTLYFASRGLNGYGATDIFVSKRLDDSWTNWSEPKNLGPNVNGKGWEGYFTIPADGTYAYLVSEGDIGNSDIYRVELPKEAQPEPVELIQGHVYNAKTKQPISGTITLTDLNTNQLVAQATSHPLTGYFEMVLPKGKHYALFANKEKFYAVRENMDLKKLKSFSKKSLDLYLSPIEIGETIELNNIFFVMAKAEILPTSMPELDALVTILKDNKNIRIKIEGHTDNIGNAEDLRILSEQRANAIKNYLVKKGINRNRLEAVGYGGTRPIADNRDPKKRPLNRRVAFTIIE